MKIRRCFPSQEGPKFIRCVFTWGTLPGAGDTRRFLSKSGSSFRAAVLVRQEPRAVLDRTAGWSQGGNSGLGNDLDAGFAIPYRRACVEAAQIDPRPTERQGFAVRGGHGKA